VEAEEIMAALRDAARARQGTRSDLTSDKKLSEVNNHEHGEKNSLKRALAYLTKNCQTTSHNDQVKKPPSCSTPTAPT
jgi:flagella basal body P-ring formation protein FlgA